MCIHVSLLFLETIQVNSLMSAVSVKNMRKKTTATAIKLYIVLTPCVYTRESLLSHNSTSGWEPESL